MNPGYLILFPDTSQPPPEVTGLLQRLSDTGLIGTPLAGTPNHFLTGPQFLQRITFLGCSPNLPLAAEADTNQPVCTIQLLGPYPEMRLVTNHHGRPPRCPDCRHDLAEWRDHIEQSEWRIGCPQCGQESDLQRLNWRQTGAAARLFIAISQVFPGEAVPTGGLLETLKQGDEVWSYFYAQRPLAWPGGDNPIVERVAGVSA